MTLADLKGSRKVRKLNITSNLHIHKITFIHRVQEKKRPQYFRHNFDKFRHSFLIFGTNHPEDSFYEESRKFIPNIVTSLRSDDVIVTSLETMLSRTASGKDTTIFCLITLEN